jgi:P4 family phage/plasmid primase-like protien
MKNDRMVNKKGTEYTSFGALFHWLKKDNLKKFKELISETIVHKIISHNGNWTDYDLASLLFEKLKDKYRSDFSGRDQIFYSFENHIWKLIENPVDIDSYISKEFFGLFGKALELVQKRKIKKLDELKIDAMKETEQAKRIWSTMNKLKSYTYKAILIKELGKRLYHRDFTKKLNTKMHLFAFNNGVYDFSQGIFRDGKPEDLISVQAPCDFIGSEITKWSAENIELYNEVMTFFKTTFQNKELRKYVVKILACCLLGNNRDQVCYICCGDGGNGKSKLFELIQKSFGDDEYYSNVDIAIFTQKRGHASGPSAQFEDFRFKRIICSSESNDTDTFNLGILKDLTGGNTFKFRGMWKKRTENFSPQYRLFFQVNKPPKLTSFGEAVSRRFRYIPFETVFISPLEDKETYKQKGFKYVEYKDRTIEDKIDTWALSGVFLSWLVYVYMKFVNGKWLAIPEIVESATKNYINQNNYFEMFTDECIKYTSDKGVVITSSDMFNRYIQFTKNRGISKQASRNKKDLILHIKLKYGRTHMKGDDLTHYEFTDTY